MLAFHPVHRHVFTYELLQAERAYPTIILIALGLKTSSGLIKPWSSPHLAHFSRSILIRFRNNGWQAWRVFRCCWLDLSLGRASILRGCRSVLPYQWKEKTEEVLKEHFYFIISCFFFFEAAATSFSLGSASRSSLCHHHRQKSCLWDRNQGMLPKSRVARFRKSKLWELVSSNGKLSKSTYCILQPNTLHSVSLAMLLELLW